MVNGKNRPIWIAADFEGKNIPVDDNQVDENADAMSHAGSDNKKLSVSKPVAIGYIVVKNSYNDNLNLEKDSYNKYFGEDCAEGFINEMLEIETYLKKYFKTDIK